MQSDAKRLPALQLLVLLLPVEHSMLLRRLLNLLQCVVDEPENRMTADNLAILFVPHIIVPRKVCLCSVDIYDCVTVFQLLTAQKIIRRFYTCIAV